jgi:hypothetical protein
VLDSGFLYKGTYKNPGPAEQILCAIYKADTISKETRECTCVGVIRGALDVGDRAIMLKR